eukprot:m.192985 g.192985  ORF g.192985 m.192985 type:complete len:194 (-) comp32488_c7_seq3:1962-2543(-)
MLRRHRRPSRVTSSWCCIGKSKTAPHNVPDTHVQSSPALMRAILTDTPKRFHKRLASHVTNDFSLVLASNANRETYLHVAVASGRVGIVQVLIDDFGGPLNIRDAQGKTAVHFAVIHKQEQCLAKLIDANACLKQKVNLGQHKGKTAMTIAVDAGFPHIASMLLTAGAEPMCCDPIGKALSKAKNKNTTVYHF